MRHIIIGSGLLVFVALDVIFVEFSETPSAALVFSVLCYLILLLLSGAAGSLTSGPEPKSTEYTDYLGSLLGPLSSGTLARVGIAAFVPVLLLLLLAFIPDLDDPLDPSRTVQLGSTFAVFWLLMSLALVGAVLGFLWPKSGALDSVLVGGAVVLAQCLLTWTKADASREALQLALYTYMVWVSISLIGAWVGLILRQIADNYLAGSRGLEANPNNS